MQVCMLVCRSCLPAISLFQPHFHWLVYKGTCVPVPLFFYHSCDFKHVFNIIVQEFILSQFEFICFIITIWFFSMNSFFTISESFFICFRQVRFYHIALLELKKIILRNKHESKKNITKRLGGIWLSLSDWILYVSNQICLFFHKKV